MMPHADKNDTFANSAEDHPEDKDDVTYRVVEASNQISIDQDGDGTPDEDYLSSGKWIKLFRGTFFQMIMLGG